MQDLHFRAWIGKDKKMYDVITIMTRKFNDEDGLRVFVNKELREGEPTNYVIDGVDNVLMQGTGMKDKKLKDVYDGDFVSFGKNNIYIIKFSCGQFRLHAIDNDEYFIYLGPHLSDGEVIGNKFSNPEILNEN